MRERNKTNSRITVLDNMAADSDLVKALLAGICGRSSWRQEGSPHPFHITFFKLKNGHSCEQKIKPRRQEACSSTRMT